MQRHSKIWVIVIILGVAIFSILFYYSPYIAVNNMRKAVEAKDPITMSSYINYPSLKESLRANFNDMVAAEVMNSRDNNSFNVLGAALAAAVINPMIDTLVTPESLSMMLQGNMPKLDKGSQGDDKRIRENQDTEVSFGYESIERFAVSVRKKGDTDDPVSFVFHRDGLFTWKLASLRLPALKTSQTLSQPFENAVGKETADAGGINFAEVRERYTKSTASGDILVLSGFAVNEYKYPVARLKLRGKILDNAGKVLGEVETYAGNLLTDDELNRLTDKELMAKLQKPEGSDMPNTNIRSRMRIPFMIVFINPPKEVDEFIIELSGFESTTAVN